MDADVASIPEHTTQLYPTTSPGKSHNRPFCSLHGKICNVNAGVGLQVGICAVGISSVLSGQGSASADVTQSQILLGMALIVCSQVPTCLYISSMVLLTIRLGGIHWLIAAAAAVCVCVCHAVWFAVLILLSAVMLSGFAVMCCAALLTLSAVCHVSCD